MSSEDYKFQMSIKFGPGGIGMLNIRANTPTEFIENVNASLESVGPAAVLVEAYNTEFQAISNLAGGGFQVTPENRQPNRAATSSSGEMCQHGSMTWREGVGNNGPWKGWFCPAQKGDASKCKTKYVK